MANAVEATGLVKRFGTTALDGVDLVARPGRVLGVLGPNGAGKTTTVECVEGLRAADRGTITVLGLDPRRDRAGLTQRLGVQLQDSELPERLQVAEALRLYSSFYAEPADWRTLMDVLGLAGKSRTRFGKLSGGQKQRLSIALALVGNPRVAVLDELTTGLDPQARRDTWALIEDVRSRGVTILLVTHFTEEAERLCDRVALIDAGRVVAVDTPAGYLYAFAVLPWPWRLPGVAAVAVVAATAQTSGVDRASPFGILVYAGAICVNGIALCALAWMDWSNDTHAAQREQALAEVREANERLEATLAENAGLHEQLLTQAREAGVLDERQRMAGEIHDTLAQGLTGIITQLQAAEQASGDQAGWRRHVSAATRLARESLSEARRSVDALRPELLERAPLSDALAGVAERWSALHGIPVQVTTTGTARPMPPDAEFALLRAAQEALANVAKHARATRAGLTLSYMDDEVALDVRDDGRWLR